MTCHPIIKRQAIEWMAAEVPSSLRKRAKKSKNHDSNKGTKAIDAGYASARYSQSGEKRGKWQA
jgi:hypothetical protein